MKKTLTKIITHEEVKQEVINRQKTFGTKESPDKYINPIFRGIRFATMIFILNHWPKCNECNQYLELGIEYTEEEEIPITILYTVTDMLIED